MKPPGSGIAFDSPTGPKPDSNDARGRATTVRVSVVITTHRRPESLRRCLVALLAQSMAPDSFEIIVVDGARDPATFEVVKALARYRAVPEPSLRYLRVRRGRGPAVARNLGWQAARGALVAFTDDDTVPDREWLANGAHAMDKHPGWSALGGRISMPWLDAPRDSPDCDGLPPGRESRQFLTANAFVRRGALAKVNGLDERFTRAWREDADLQFRLMRDVGPVGRCDGAVVRHAARQVSWAQCLRRQRNGFFDALLYKKHPRLYRECIRAVPPFDHYLIVLAVLSVPLYALDGKPELASLSLGLSFSLIVQLAWERLHRTAVSPSRVAGTLLTSAVIPFLSVYWRLKGALRFRVLFL
jgi:GT2 family glycosyltransferase